MVEQYYEKWDKQSAEHTQMEINAASFTAADELKKIRELLERIAPNGRVN